LVALFLGEKGNFWKVMGVGESGMVLRFKKMKELPERGIGCAAFWKKGNFWKVALWCD